MNEPKFVPGKTYIRPSGVVYYEDAAYGVIDAVKDSFSNNTWATQDKYNRLFEKELRRVSAMRYAHLCNSGSSANLLALSIFTSNEIHPDERLKIGDRVITCATGFPTTVNPIIQNGLIPIFVDVDIETGNIRLDHLERTLQYKPKAIMIAHTLGFPWDVGYILDFAKQHNLYVISDCCDALFAEWNNKSIFKYGDISTLSMYPAHHISAGEGGAVFTNRSLYSKLLKSFRDWGRDCWCDASADNTCGKRFDQQFGDLPHGYDHKYVYTNVGYNLKMSNLNAAVGYAQIRNSDNVQNDRLINWRNLRIQLSKYEDYFIFQVAQDNSLPSPFGFLITLRDGVSFTRNELTQYLEEHKIGTRLLFGGNLIRQPLYYGKKYITVDRTKNSDKMMNDSFWIGVWPGITNEMITYITSIFDKFMEEYK